MHWKPKNDYSNLILAIHGYNDYSNSFQIPGSYLSDHKIGITSFDLKGFGRNNNIGRWYELNNHIEDVIFNLNKIKKENPKKKIFILGESMGGAISLSLVNRHKKLPIDGVILVAPAIWNFTETNFWKSLPLKFLSKIFPKFKVSGKGIIKIQASNNLKMLKELSNDKFFVHKPTLNSLQGIVDLMDESFIDAEEYFKNPSYETLILVPLKDEIVPRKPLIELLKEQQIAANIPSKIKIGVYEDSYHMILRDLNGNKITKDIKEWIYDKKSLQNRPPYIDIFKKFENTQFYHRLDL